MAKNTTRVGKAFKWLGIQANNRAILSLLAIGTIIGGVLVFLIDQVAPLYSPSLSKIDFGEGYRRGMREAELENRVRELEHTLNSIRLRDKADQEVKSMTPEQRRKYLEKWVRD